MKDINNYMRKFFMPVLSILKDKAGEEAKLAASLDFRIPREAIQPQIGQVGIRNVKSYSPNYVRSKVQLKDGAILEFSVADQIHDFSWYKTNARKKRKYKNNDNSRGALALAATSQQEGHYDDEVKQTLEVFASKASKGTRLTNASKLQNR